MATAIQVILTEDSTAGKAGELIKAKPGFVRNFLLPKGLAVVADAYNLQAFEERKAEIEKLAEERRQAAESNKESIGEEAVVEVESKAGETGKLFGAITKEKIASAASEQLKLELTKDNIKLSSPIKTIGEHEVELALGSNVSTKITVKVVSEK